MVSFRLFAGTDVGLRDNNEDNFTICPDLTLREWVMPAGHQQLITLGERGCLMVVADGMGGQNAGEVASAIAIDTVQRMFAPECLTDKVMDKSSTIKDYLKKVILQADVNVKDYSKCHSEAEGLGSTIVMAWVLGCKVYIAWLGDSRAYAFVPHQGIRRLSKDHSYVQQLVDVGSITDIEAMNHPNSNVITRSLGDMSQKAKADVEEYVLKNGEIILLCSDGLCGVCTDEEIAGVLNEHADNLQECKELLTELALGNDGSDNITMALMHVVTDETERTTSKSSVIRRILLVVLVLFGFVLAAMVVWNGKTPKKEPSPVVHAGKSKPSVKVSSPNTKSETRPSRKLEESSNGDLKDAIIGKMVDVQNDTGSVKSDTGSVTSSEDSAQSSTTECDID